MARSEVQICNIALARTGVSKTIASIDPPEQTQESKICATFYEHCRDRALEDFPWLFARRAVALQKVVTTAITPGWEYQYAYPNDCLRALHVCSSAGIQVATSDSTLLSIPKIPFTQWADPVANRKLILCNMDEMYLVYTARITNPTMFTAAFDSSLAWLISSEIAGPLTSNKALGQQSYNSYLAVAGEAFAANLSEAYEGGEIESEFISVR